MYEYKVNPNPRKQSEQQVLARNEGRALANVGMIQSQIDSLFNLGFITKNDANFITEFVIITRNHILQAQYKRMLAAGTWKKLDTDY